MMDLLLNIPEQRMLNFSNIFYEFQEYKSKD